MGWPVGSFGRRRQPGLLKEELLDEALLDERSERSDRKEALLEIAEPCRS